MHLLFSFSKIMFSYIQQGIHRVKKINEIMIAGLALDLGITQTALDAKELGYSVEVIQDLCPSYRIPKDKVKERWFILQTEGIKLIPFLDLMY